MAFHIFRLSWLLLALLGGALSGCTSDAADVCENVGACAQGGDSEWIRRCSAEAKLLGVESNGSGCGSAYDAYYSCEAKNFECHGATPVFPGCDQKRKDLGQCLSRAQASTACGRLSIETSACGGTAVSRADAGSDAGVPPACTASRECQAQCFLDQIGNVCKPRVDELSTFTTCAASCPP